VHLLVCNTQWTACMCFRGCTDWNPDCYNGKNYTWNSKCVKICCIISNWCPGISWMRQWDMSPTSISICLSTREVQTLQCTMWLHIRRKQWKTRKLHFGHS